ncbi:MAG: Xaa-Pro peptidase family protein, partial [Gammaproteobacteria bacterium]|nr:Xaa-Pro peptidase family protein [Gammaproteobacteria bacterium]
ERYQAFGPKAWLPASGIAVRVDSDDYMHFEVENEEILAGFTSVSTDLRIFRSSSQPMHSLQEFIINNLKDAGWLKGTAGLEMWSYRPNRGYSEQFQAALEQAGCKVVDATEIVGQVRKLKSAQEIAYTKTAARIGDIGMKAALDFIRPGVTELDVYGEIVNAMAKAGGENPSITMPVSSGGKSACMHALASRKKIMPGDIVNIDLCGVYNRYHSNMARTFSMGEPHSDVAEHLQTITGAKTFVAGIITPGLPVQSLLREIESYYREADIWDDQCWIGGYDLGISFPPDWVGPWYYDVHTDPGDEVFEPGMVCNYEANFYLPQSAGMSMFIETMAVGEDQVEFLHSTPARLFVIE